MGTLLTWKRGPQLDRNRIGVGTELSATNYWRPVVTGKHVQGAATPPTPSATPTSEATSPANLSDQRELPGAGRATESRLSARAENAEARQPFGHRASTALRSHARRDLSIEGVPGSAPRCAPTPMASSSISILAHRDYAIPRKRPSRSSAYFGAMEADRSTPTESGLRPRLAPHPEAHPESCTTQLRWLAMAAVVGFAAPFVGSSILGLQHDVYLGIYFVAVARASVGLRVVRRAWTFARFLLRNWKLGVALGVVFGIVLVRNVFSEHATPHPSGAYYWFELLWRGGIYGAVDALLLTVLPSLVVYRSLGGHLRSWRLRLEYFGASLALIVSLTAIYHLGYTQYRQDGVRAPETGNVIISMPMLLSANPIGSVADHMAMHISSVQHEYNTEVRLPPATKAR